MTNREFAEKDTEFRRACENVPVTWMTGANAPTLPPTTRQASKWRRQRGLAWTKGRRPQP